MGSAWAARAVDVSDWVAAPVGRYALGRCWLAWCVSRRCAGFAIWGRPDVEEMRVIAGLHDVVRSPRLERPVDVVIDAGRLEHVSTIAAMAYLEAAVPRLDGFRAAVRRRALVAPPGLVGMMVAGFYSVVRDGPDARLVDELDSALAWVNATGDLARVRELVDGIAGRPDPLGRLHGLLAQGASRAWSVESAAGALGTSVRGLQRRLRDLGTTFRAEVHRSRLARATGLLAQGDAKLDAVAAAVGFRSLPAFTAWFRERTGRVPSHYRRLAAGAGGVLQ